MQILRGGAAAAACAILGACSAAGTGAGSPDARALAADAPLAQPPDATSFVDDDHDGLDDARELQLAADYQPFVSIDPNDGCALDGFVVRVTPHPADATKILIIYDQLFQDDCGLNGHVGDDEVFSVAIDPS